MAQLPDFGRHLGSDGKTIESRSIGRVRGEDGTTSDPDADWGHYETRGVDARTVQLWSKVKRWLGNGLHRIADTVARPPLESAPDLIRGLRMRRARGLLSQRG